MTHPRKRQHLLDPANENKGGSKSQLHTCCCRSINVIHQSQLISNRNNHFLPITPLGKSGAIQDTLAIREVVDCSSCGHSQYDELLQPDIILEHSDTDVETSLALNKFVICFSTIIFLLDGSQQIVQVFLPLYFERHNIPQDQIGYIQAVFAFIIAFLSPQVSQLNEFLGGRRMSFIISVILLAFSNASFGVMAYLGHNSIDLTICYLSNFFQGVAYTIIYTTVYSMGLVLYPRDQNKFVAYIGTGSALGISLAPLMAGLIIPIGGYHWMFFSLGILIIAAAIWVVVVFKDYTEEIQEAVQDCGGAHDGDERDTTVGYFSIMYNRKYILALCALLFMQFSQSAMGPGLGLTVKHHHLDIRQISLFTGIYPVFYVISLQTVSRVSGLLKKRGIIMLSLFLSFPINFLVGPSTLVDLPGKGGTLFIMGLGQALRGFFDCYQFVFVLPELIDQAKKVYDNERQDEIVDLSTKIFVQFVQVGQIFGPVFGSQEDKFYGFMSMADTLAFLSLAQGLIYFSFGSGCTAFQKPYEQDQEQQQQSRLDLEQIADFLTPPPGSGLIGMRVKKRSLSHLIGDDDEKEGLLQKIQIFEVSETHSDSVQSYVLRNKNKSSNQNRYERQTSQKQFEVTKLDSDL